MYTHSHHGGSYGPYGNPTSQPGLDVGGPPASALRGSSRDDAIDSAPPIVVDSLFADYPSDSAVSFLEHMMSDSSAEDDMTLGPDPDSVSIERGLSSLLESQSPRIQSPSLAGTSSSQQHLSQQQQHLLHHRSLSTMSSSGYPMSNGNGDGISGGGVGGGGLGHSMNNPGHSSSMTSIYGATPDTASLHTNASYEISPSSNRLKRSSNDMPESSHMGPARKKSRLETIKSESPNMSPHSSGSGGGPSSEGYYYRSRVKTNYNQAHKGTLPSPPATPDAQKRIRCTWNLEETRVLYDLLKDIAIENFPDAQQIRQHLMKMDPGCTKTLDHVRNKKANLIQKAHSKNVTVAEILLSDMAKLEQELPGPRPGTISVPMGISGSSGSAGAAGALEGAQGGAGGASTRMIPAIAHRPAGSSSKVSAARPARRRGVPKRGMVGSSLVPLIQVPTATEQQLARVTASNRSSLDGGNGSGGGAGEYPTSNPSSSGSASTGPLSPMNPSSSSSNLSYGTGNGMAMNTGSSIGGAYSIAPFKASAPHLVSIPTSTTAYNSPYTQQSELQKWQLWVSESLNKLCASQNEIRSQLQLPPVELTSPPPTINSTAMTNNHANTSGATAAAATNTTTAMMHNPQIPIFRGPSSTTQWISSWSNQDSLDSETESTDENSTGPNSMGAASASTAPSSVGVPGSFGSTNAEGQDSSASTPHPSTLNYSSMESSSSISPHSSSYSTYPVPSSENLIQNNLDQ